MLPAHTTAVLFGQGGACRVCLAGPGGIYGGSRAAFETLGGVPYGQIRYDNLRSAVHRVLFGRNRIESLRWAAFRAHFGFTSFYCIPGREGAHEKGGVEGDGGWFRRTHLVPVPRVDTLAELNAVLAAADVADDARHIDRRASTVGADFAAERAYLIPCLRSRSTAR